MRSQSGGSARRLADGQPQRPSSTAAARDGQELRRAWAMAARVATAPQPLVPRRCFSRPRSPCRPRIAASTRQRRRPRRSSPTWYRPAPLPLCGASAGDRSQPPRAPLRPRRCSAAPVTSAPVDLSEVSSQRPPRASPRRPRRPAPSLPRPSTPPHRPRRRRNRWRSRRRPGGAVAAAADPHAAAAAPPGRAPPLCGLAAPLHPPALPPRPCRRRRL